MPERQCSKPLCAAPAVASMSYDYANRSVFVGQLLPERHPAYYDLCRSHIDALVPPRGWTLRREPLVRAGGADDDSWARPLTVVREDRAATNGSYQ